MSPFHYRDFVLIAEQAVDSAGDAAVAATVFASPAGASTRVTSALGTSAAALMAELERRQLDIAGVRRLGVELANLLLPDEVRALLLRSIDMLKPEQGLRLRLRVDPGLADIPWEYVYLQRTPGADDNTGFLALNPKLSCVRYEALPLPGELDVTARERRLLVVAASPDDQPELDTTQECAQIKTAVRDLAGVRCDILDNATLAQLNDALLAGADILHFAGHGIADWSRSPNGMGAIALMGADGSTAYVAADQLAINLQSRGIQLAVLGACETGRRSGHNVWNDIATTLLRVGIPAVVAMQYVVLDESALAFCRSFYRALAAGQAVDEAVAAGRQAIFNQLHAQVEDLAYRGHWSDWGVPVLYLRAEQEVRLPVAAEREAQALPQQPAPVSLPAGVSGEGASRNEPGLGEIADIADKLRQGRLTLFVGADLPEAAAGAPNRQALADGLARRAGLTPGLRLAEVCQQTMRHGNRFEFTNYLLQKLQPTNAPLGPFYVALARLAGLARPHALVTTAYHRLLERALEQAELHPFAIIQDNDLHFADRQQTLVLKLYGDITRVDSLIATVQDEHALLAGGNHRELLSEVRRVFRQSSILFLGHDLSDPAVLALFDGISGSHFQQRSYAAWHGLSTAAVQSLDGNRNLTVLDADPVALLDALATELERPSSRT